MDILDNVIYASYQSPLQLAVAINANQMAPGNRIISNYIPIFQPPVMPVDEYGNYTTVERMDFCAYEDAAVIENAVTRHWWDIDNLVNYDTGGITGQGGAANGLRLASFEESSNYHLLASYLVENTRILQIFERFIEKYFYDEEFGISANNQVNAWINNTEQLFYQGDTLTRSMLRPNTEAVRRNAYWRMFGMDLAFGDANSKSTSIPYYKSKSANHEFIPLFEKYLAEIWQAYINARNTSGENRSDINVLTDLATELRELLIARRGDVNNTTYANQAMSREEFRATFLTSWFAFIISDDTPVVQFLNCQSSTMGERLIKIGNKVGIPAHSRSQYLFEMMQAVNVIMITIEAGGIFDDELAMQNIISSLNPAPLVAPDPNDVDFMTHFLTIINNWEKATGHKIKNPEANIIGSVRIQQQNGTKARQARPVMN